MISKKSLAAEQHDMTRPRFAMFGLFPVLVERDSRVYLGSKFLAKRLSIRRLTHRHALGAIDLSILAT